MVLEKLVDVTVGSVSVEEGYRRIGEVRLRRFQEEVLEEYARALRGNPKALVYLKAPTGSGKTLSVLTPLMAGQACKVPVSPESPVSSMAVYPSRKLLVDQACNVSRLLGLLGYRLVEPVGRLSGVVAGVEAPYGFCPEGGRPRVVSFYDGPLGRVALLLLFSDALDALEDALGVRGRREVYLRLEEALLREERVTAIVSLASTEYPSLFMEALSWNTRDYERFLHAGARMASCIAGGACEDLEVDLVRNERSVAMRLFKVLLAGDMLFIDEAHLYSRGSAFPVATAASWYLAFGGTRTSFLVVSTATHTGPGYRALDSVLRRAAEAVNARIVTVEARPGRVIVRKPVRLTVYGYKRSYPTMPGWMQNAVAQEALDSLAESDEVVEAAARIVGGGRTFMLLGGRLYYVRLAGEKLVERLRERLGSGFQVECIDSLARIEPLAPNYCGGGDGGGRLVVGSSAVSYGVDYPDADGGLIYARSSEEIIQKLGRLGRRPGEGEPESEAFLVTGYNYAWLLKKRLGEAAPGNTIDPGSLERALAELDRARPPTLKGGSLAALHAVKALYQLSLMILAFRTAFGGDAVLVAEKLKRVASVVAEALAEASGAGSDKVRELAEKLSREAPPPGPAAESLRSLASPRTVLRVSVEGFEAPLHQLLRLHLYSDLDVRDRLDFAVVVDSLEPLRGVFNRFLPGSSVARALRDARASLVQLGGYERCFEESGSKGFQVVADSLSDRIVYVEGPLKKPVTAYIAYHEINAIPIVALGGQAKRNICSLYDLLEAAGRGNVAVAVPL